MQVVPRRGHLLRLRRFRSRWSSRRTIEALHPSSTPCSRAAVFQLPPRRIPIRDGIERHTKRGKANGPNRYCVSSTSKPTEVRSCQSICRVYRLKCPAYSSSVDQSHGIAGTVTASVPLGEIIRYASDSNSDVSSICSMTSKSPTPATESVGKHNASKLAWIIV